MRNEFIFHKSFYDAISWLPTEELQFKAFHALCEYVFNGKMPIEDDETKGNNDDCIIQAMFEITRHFAELD